MSAIQVPSTGDSAETLTLFQNDVERQVMQEFNGYEPKREDGSYVEGTIVPIFRLESLVETVLCCLLKTE